MAVINDNFTVRAPVPVDDRKGWWDGSDWQPFTSRQDALDKTPYYRYRTLTLPVVENGDVVEYWFKSGVEDSDFVLKTSQVDLSNYYTKTELQTSGQSQVHWDNLTNIPDLSVTWENITGDQSVIGNAGFTNDAQYITAADLPPIPSPLTFENGLREDGGVVKLGLDLTTIGTTNAGILTEDLFFTRFDENNNPYYQVIFGVDTLPGLYFTHVSDTDNPNNVQSSLVLSNNQAILERKNSLGIQSINVGVSGLIVIEDTINNKGLQYQSDNSAVGTLDPRWIPDWGTVKDYVDNNTFDPSTLPGFGLSWNSGTNKIDWGETSPFGSGELHSVQIPSGDAFAVGDVNGTAGGGTFMVSPVGFTMIIGTNNLAMTSASTTSTGVIEYFADYSSSYTNRSLVDKEYVDNLIPDLTGYATEQWVLDQNYLTSVTSSWNINTGDLTIQGNTHNLDGRYMLRSNTITSGYGIIASADFSNPVSIEVDTDVLDNRYLRKDTDDSNNDNILTTGYFINNTTATFNGGIYTPFLPQGSITDQMLVYDPSDERVKYIDMPNFGGTFNVANNAGTPQFTVDSGETIRFHATGDASIAFNAGTKTITINSSGGSSGGGVDSWNARTGAVVPAAGDYNTSLVDEDPSALYFTAARVRSTTLTGLSISGSSITATDTVLSALGKAQGQINSLVPESRSITINGTSGNITVSGGTQTLAANRTWTINLANKGTAGTYTKVVTDAQGRVTAGGLLTVSDLPSSVIQTLEYTAPDSSPSITSGGRVSISDGNSISINTLFLALRPDADLRYNGHTFSPYYTSSGNTGYPSTSNAAGIRIERRSNDTNQLGYETWTAGSTTSGNPIVHIRNFTGTSSYSSWNILATREWVNTVIPTNYVTTDTTQTGLTGNKYWDGAARWAPTGTASSKSASIGIGAGTSGVWLQGWQSSSTTPSFLLRGYSSSGIQLELYEGGVNAPTTATVADGPYRANGKVILGANNSGATVVAATDNIIYLRPNAPTSSTGQVQISATSITASQLTGSGTQMVTVNASGVLGRQAIPNMSGYLPLTGGTLTGNLGINTFLTIQRGSSGYLFNISGTGYSTYNRIELGRTDGSTTIRVNSLSGSGNRMVVANSNGDLSTQTIPAVGVTSITAGNGMNFSTITGSGAVTMGTPGTLTSSTSNSVSSTSHTHALGQTVFISMGSLGSTNLNDITQAGNGAQTTAAEATAARNYPITGGGGTLISTAAVNNYRTQFFNERAANRMFWRGFNGSSWSDWKEFYHSGNFANGTTSQYIRGNGTLATFPSIPTVNNGTLTMATGDGLSGSDTFSANQSTNTTFTVSLTNIASGSTAIGALRYNGTTRSAGRLYGGSTNPNTTTRLNYNGILHAYDFVGYGTSDRRLKEQITPISNPLEKLSQIGGYSFKWKDGHDSYSGDDYGVIAQEVEKVLPEIVSERGGVKAIKTGNQLTGLLIAGFNELVKRVEALENGVS